jgi:beta-glucosidase
MTEKSSIFTGKLSLGVGGCIDTVFLLDCVGFASLCMQDGTNGVNIADLTNALLFEMEMGASWENKLMYQR